MGGAAIRGLPGREQASSILSAFCLKIRGTFLSVEQLKVDERFDCVVVALAAAIHWLLLAVTSHQLIVIVTSDWLLLLEVTRQCVEWGGHTGEEDTKQRKHQHNLDRWFFPPILSLRV